MDCCVCFSQFDRNARKPIMGSCGHSVCQQCLESLKTNNKPNCPTCNKPNAHSQGTVNYQLMDVIVSEAMGDIRGSVSQKIKENRESRAGTQYETCSKCRKQEDEKYMRICKKCDLSGISKIMTSNFAKALECQMCTMCSDSTHAGSDHPTVAILPMKHDVMPAIIHNNLSSYFAKSTNDLKANQLVHLNTMDKGLIFNRTLSYQVTLEAEKMTVDVTKLIDLANRKYQAELAEAKRVYELSVNLAKTRFIEGTNVAKNVLAELKVAAPTDLNSPERQRLAVVVEKMRTQINDS